MRRLPIQLKGEARETPGIITCTERNGHARPMTALLAGIKLMLGKDPKKEYKDKVAEVELTN
jgi:hypothetical protein